MIGRLRSFLLQCSRVWQLLRKPDSFEFKTISKVAALGILAIGLLGFIVSAIVTLLWF